MNTQLKKGYKKTEIGVIPEEWEVVKLIDVSLLITKGTTPKKFTDSGINYIKIESLLGDTINIEKCLFVNEILHNTDLKRSILNEGDLLFAIAGATIGKCTIVPKKIIPANTNQALAIIRLKESESRKYVFYFLKSPLMQKYIIDNIAGGAQPNLNLEQIGRFKFPLPPLSEQKAIAEVLSDTDAYISSLEKLIQKKQAIKQAAMQKLLTPKENWEVRKLGEIVDVLDNLRVALNDSQRNNMKGDIPYCGANGVMDYVNDFVIDDEIILMAEDGGYFDEYKTRPIAYRMNGKCWVNNHAHILKSKSNISQDYIFYSLVHKNIINFIVGGTRAKLNKSNLLKIPIPIPPTLIEQQEISEILSDMDLELEGLSKKLDKAKQIKQGMMQDLLTGRVQLSVISYQ